MSKPFGAGASAFALTLSLLASAASAATTYHLTDLGLGVATGLNDLGQVVGYTLPTASIDFPAIPNGRGFVLDTVGGGGTQYLAPLAGFDTATPTSINNAGQIVGALTRGNAQSGFTQSAFLYSPGSGNGAGSMKALGTLGGAKLYSLEIGDGGHVVGLSDDANGLRHVMFKQPGSDALQDVTPVKGAPDYVLNTVGHPKVNASGQLAVTYVYMSGMSYVSGPNGSALKSLQGRSFGGPPALVDINDQGLMASSDCLYRFGCQAAFVDANGELTSVADPFKRIADSQTSQSGSAGASEINNARQLAGSFSSIKQPYVPFLSQADGKDVTAVEDLVFDDPEVLAQLKIATRNTYQGTAFSSIAGLNNLGQLLLNGGNGNIYLLSPVPEPATVLSMLTGLAAIGGLAMHRRRKA